ncbi:MAG: c-type cytochrome [Woeseia sp.]
MKLFVRHLVLAAVLFALTAAILVYAGVYNVSARAGHLPPTAWLLHFAMRKSVRTHAIGIEVPSLDDTRMIIRGATYFSIGCAACHGEPGNRYTPVVNEMTPRAPPLAPVIGAWKIRELFWVVKNGIKYTGMPAWATAERDDEVWDMVSFLLRLPDLDVEEYRKLAYEPGPRPAQRSAITNLELADRVGSTIEQCARCHGFDGMGRGTTAFPYLAGQKEEYLYRSLRHFANGDRSSGVMEPVAAALFDSAMRQVATHYANTRPVALPVQPPVDRERVARGAAIAAAGLQQKGVPACRHCHGPGNVAENPHFPHLAGQNEDYLRRQLELFKRDARGGTPYAPLMSQVAEGLTQEQMREVAAFYASLPYFASAAK